MSNENEDFKTETQPLHLQKDAASPRLTTLLNNWLGSDIFSDRKEMEEDRTAEEQYGEELHHTENAVEDRDGLQQDYELHEEIARGGHGMIRRATDRLLGRETAIKTLLDGLPDQDEARKAFLVEAKIMAQLDHPAVVPVYGVCGGENGSLHMAMKLVRGKTLEEYLAGLIKVYRKMSRSRVCSCERLALAQRLEIFLNVCSAISYVHFRGVIHRDLKPENIMIGSYNETYVMDWGIAEYRLNGKRHRGSERLQGTPQYIAPEVINRCAYDSRADIYSLGLILFELIYLHPAYEALSIPATIELAKQGKVGKYRHLFGVHIDKDLEMIIRKALSFDPEERYLSVKMLAADLRRWREGEEVTAYPDNPFRRMLRDMRHHSRLVGSCAAVVIALLLSFGGCVYYRDAELRMELQKRNEEQAARVKKQEALFSTVFRRGAEAVSWLNGRFYRAESLLDGLARETALMLESMPETPCVSWAIHPENGHPGPGVVPSATYGYPLSFDCFVCKPSSRMTPEMEKELKQLSHLRNSFFRVLAGSSFDCDELLQDPRAAVRTFRDRKRPPVTRAYVGLADGMHLGYPCHFLYRKDYDPRNRPWYQAAIAAKNGLPVWSVPYFDRSDKDGELIISCSREVRDSRGRSLGVAGLDLSFDSLVRDVQEDGEGRPHVEDGFLLDGQGRILCSLKKGVLKDAEGSSTASLADFHDREVWKNMQGKPSGTCFGEWNGTRYLYYFAKLRIPGCYFVVMLNYEKMQ